MSKAEAMQARPAWGLGELRSSWKTSKRRCTHASQTAPTLHPPLQKYIDLVAEGDPNWETHEALTGYKEEEAQ